ncbi:3-oxoadipate enol-lactonase 2 [Nocardioides dokdonensis FR1436]|uniref:3-oxoadipate enol-lactonase 2 n=1 Tax=Nocardioides dokdonensis FR1436 TaxID=1300347 RepID=A0A1A9GLS1_9ACTN|nr:alpha/beta fold hydrolase [Nocardioides dokdonensis]ANH39239.1 3-oxoadipate enol-lactonase 2 [Nocardioides dokdonensis FR1436]
MTNHPDRRRGRARAPDHVGVVERDGVRIAFEVFGGPDDAPEGRTERTTILLMPTWTVIDSRFWKAQVAYLARHHRVVTFDGRGSGASDKPAGPAAYTNEQYAADAVAVLDATGTDTAVLVALSCGSAWAVHVAADHPERVLGLFVMSPSCGFAMVDIARDQHPFDARVDTTEGWAKYNRHFWADGGYQEFLDFFFAQMYTEAHSSKQIEDSIGWGLDVDPAVLADATSGRIGCHEAVCAPLEPVCARVRCPVLVVHGTADAVRGQQVGERLAELTGGSLVLLDGAGHGPMARHPVRINLMIRDFVEQLCPRVRRATWVAAPLRRRRVLYLSSPIGLGHARRDVAVVEELRKQHPDVEVDWLAQHPVTDVLRAAGERVHPASRWLASESEHIEHEAGEHDLHAFQAIREMDAVLVNNFMVFAEVVETEHYDLVVGDEAWDVDYFLHENPELKRFAFAWMTDFVGWLPMPDGGSREERLTADYNAEMIEQRARFARVRDRSIFVGSPDDVVPDRFGPGLPRIRDWVAENFDFAGYVTGFDPADYADRDALRARLDLPVDQPLCVVTVGGSGVGEPLIRRVLDAVPLARRQVPDLRFLVVAGPRIEPRSLPRRRGASVVGHVPRLYQHLAASDLAVVQGGLTTTMELTASRRPFVYVPLRHHFEQNFHVRHRLERYGAGRCLDYDEASDPDALAAVIAADLGRDVAYRPVETEGATRAASLLAELL